MTDAPNILSPSFPTGLSGLRSEKEVRESRSQARLKELPKPCPWCGEDPPLAAFRYPSVPHPEIRDRYTVCCENEECPAQPAVSGYTVEEAWKKWNQRAPVLTVAASNTDLELAGSTKGIG